MREAVTLWNQIVEILRESIFAYAQVSNGNLAVGILAVAFLARLALFPLTLWLARVTCRPSRSGSSRFNRN